MRSDMKHRLQYIYWEKEIDVVNVTWQEGKEMLAWYKENGVVAKSKTKVEDWMTPSTYMALDKGNWMNLRVHDAKKKRFLIYTWHKFNNEKNDGTAHRSEGLQSMQLINNHFKMRTGKTLRGGFGYSDKELKRCVPRPFYYINSRLLNRNLSNISKADYSSNYPSHACGRLPTMQNSVVVDGVVEPSSEYPFAFYLDTGHSCELNVYDTRKWYNYSLGWQLMVNRDGSTKFGCIENETRTLLCKASPYELTEEYSHFYDVKKSAVKDSTEYKDAKMVMNSSIGYMHPNDKSGRQSYRLFHLAAVTLCRAAQTMLEKVEEIGAERIVQIVVDGIIYSGDDKIGVEESRLGCLKQEWVGCDFRMRGTNAYIFMKDGVCLEAKHGGYDDNLLTTRLEDIDKWTKK